jgi:hypothetical protein
MRRIEATTVRTVDLGYEQMLVLEHGPGARVHVLFGGIWLTEEGLPEDVFARGGQVVALRSRKRALLEALGPTRVEVIESAGARNWAGTMAAAAAARMRRALRHAAARTGLALRGTLAATGLIMGVTVPALVVLGMTSMPPALIGA